MMSKKMIKIICIIMAALMVLSVFAVCLQVFPMVQCIDDEEDNNTEKQDESEQTSDENKDSTDN